MREKVFKVLNKIYGTMMTISFFAGILPLIPFVIAIIIGGPTGEAMALFVAKQVYPWIIALASIAVIIGLITMYVGRIDDASVAKAMKNNNR